MALETEATPTQLGLYDLIGKIAEGGMATVYQARHRLTQEIVALKVINPETARNPTLLCRFEREFLTARSLDHPHIVRMFEYCGTGPTPYLVMEYIEGESLAQRIGREGPLSEIEALRIMTQIALGLQRAHKQGLIHRDVKPDNILLTNDGLAKLADLGLVREVDGLTNLTKTGRGLGTLHYMAPEQFRDAKSVDARTDVYALGATLYSMLTGRVPFSDCGPLECWMRKAANEFPPPRASHPAVSERVDWAIRRAMSAEPSRRPNSCREFVEDLTGRCWSRGATPPPEEPDSWVLFWREETGTSQSIEGETPRIRQAILELRPEALANACLQRRTEKAIQSVCNRPEFRDLVVAPAPLPNPRQIGACNPKKPVEAPDLQRDTLEALSETTSGRRDQATVPTLILPVFTLIQNPGDSIVESLLPVEYSD